VYGAAALALAVPFLFSHDRYQPGIELPGGIDVAPSDLAVGALVVLALVGSRGRLTSVLRAGAAAYVVIAAFLLWIGIELVLPELRGRSYDLGSHLVSAAAFVEYALLAAAVPLLIRGRRELTLAAGALVAWSGVATAFGLVQFLGVDMAEASPLGHRQPSFVGYQDFAALSGGAAVLGFAAVALGSNVLPRRVAAFAAFAGLLGLGLSGSLAAEAGMVAAAGLVLLLAGRRGGLGRRDGVVLVAGLAASVVLTFAVRGGDLNQFVRFVGLLPAETTTEEDVQTFSHRTLLGYLGVRVFASDPLLGAGWHATNEYVTLAPYLDDARRRFPAITPEAFPSPELPYGIQNSWIQSAADLGAPGFLLFGLALLVPIWLGARRIPRAPPTAAFCAATGSGMLVVCAGIWTAQGLVPAIPTDALMWLGVAFVVMGASGDDARLD